MKRTVHYLFLLSLTAIFILGCTVQKRQFRKGYTIHFKNNKSVQEDDQNEAKVSFVSLNPEKKASAEFIENKLVASVHIQKSEKQELQTAVQRIAQPKKRDKLDLNKCDTIRLLSGEIIIATINSESTKEILYQVCGKENGSKFFLRHTEIESISYYDGRVKQFNAIEKEENLGSDSKSSSSSNSGRSERSQIVALILALLVGTLGAHRFYLGHYVVGVIYLLTGGLCLIGVLVDIILIITGDLRPRPEDFDYIEDL